MALLATEAIVLHVADYLESSRVLRLVTREAGVQSVVARGARNSKKRFGSAIDLFAVGSAHIEVRPTRDLHTLVDFEVVRAQSGLAENLSRFSAAAVVAECVLRMVHDEAAHAVFDGLIDGFRELEHCASDAAVAATLGILWRLARDIGFAPSLDSCAECHADLNDADSVAFSHAAGGSLCQKCASRSPGSRRLPASARQALATWLSGSSTVLSYSEKRAHQRLFREFLSHHVSDHRPLRAYLSWEAESLEGGAGGDVSSSGRIT